MKLFSVVLLGLVFTGSAVAQVSSELAEEQPILAAEIAADDAQAKVFYERGKAAFEGGEFEKALKHFRKAYELTGRQALLYNIGNTAERLRMDEVALKAYRQYLDELPNADNHKTVEHRIAALEKVLARRVIVAPRDSEPRVEAHKSQPRVEPQPRRRPTPAPESVDVKPEPVDLQPSGPDNTLPIALFVASGALVVAGGITGIVALGADSDLDDLCGSERICDPEDARERSDLADDIDTYSLVTDVLLVLGVASGVVGALLLDTSTEEVPQVACSSDGCLGSIQWRF